MAENVAGYTLKRLRAGYVHPISGCPGDGINPIGGRARRLHDPELVQVRHEEMAAIHLVNGLYDDRSRGAHR